VIQLHADWLILKKRDQEMVPCTPESVMVEVLGETAKQLDGELIQHAASAVLHYFKSDLGQQEVSLGEFSLALEKVLHGLGVDIVAAGPGEAPQRVVESDLRLLVEAGDLGLELVLFSRLRQELKNQLSKAPRVLRFNGLRECVKRTTGARRWNPQCQQLSDQIVKYLRDCLAADGVVDRCALVVC
jgi:hypothetical protein